MRRITLWLLCAALVGCLQRSTYTTQAPAVDVAIDDAPQAEWRHWTAWILAGSSIDPPGQEGLAYLTAQLIGEAGEQTAETEGGSWTTHVGHDWTELALRCPTAQASACQTHFLTTLAKPEFSEERVAKWRNETHEVLPDPSEGSILLHELVFEGHGYAHHKMGRAQSIAALGLHDVHTFHARQYTQATMLFGTDHDPESLRAAVSEYIPSSSDLRPLELSHFLPVRHPHTPVLTLHSKDEPIQIRAARVGVGASQRALLPERWHLYGFAVPYDPDTPLDVQLDVWRSTPKVPNRRGVFPDATTHTPPALHRALRERYDARPRPEVLHPANDLPWPWVFLVSGDPNAVEQAIQPLLSASGSPDKTYVVHAWRGDED